MVKKENLNKRGPMNVSIESRLLGFSITIFVLLLTLRVDFLEREIIILQLAFSMPFILASMISNAKIVDLDSFRDYYLFNRITNATGISLIFNTVGLLVTSYASKTVGILFFSLLIILLICLLAIDFNKRKLYNEGLMILLVLIFGLIPALIT